MCAAAAVVTRCGCALSPSPSRSTLRQGRSAPLRGAPRDRGQQRPSDTAAVGDTAPTPLRHCPGTVPALSRGTIARGVGDTELAALYMHLFAQCTPHRETPPRSGDAGGSDAKLARSGVMRSLLYKRVSYCITLLPWCITLLHYPIALSPQQRYDIPWRSRSNSPSQYTHTPSLLPLALPKQETGDNSALQEKKIDIPIGTQLYII